MGVFSQLLIVLTTASLRHSNITISNISKEFNDSKKISAQAIAIL